MLQPPGMLEPLLSRLGGLPLASSGSWAGMLLTHPTMHKTTLHCKESNVSGAEGNAGDSQGLVLGHLGDFEDNITQSLHIYHLL